MESGNALVVLLTITTRYNQVAAEPFLFAITLSNPSIPCVVNPQLKKAIVLRDGHNGGCPANESKAPVAQDVAAAMTRVSNAGSWANNGPKKSGVRTQGAMFT